MQAIAADTRTDLISTSATRRAVLPGRLGLVEVRAVSRDGARPTRTRRPAHGVDLVRGAATSAVLDAPRPVRAVACGDGLHPLVDSVPWPAACSRLQAASRARYLADGARQILRVDLDGRARRLDDRANTSASGTLVAGSRT